MHIKLFSFGTFSVLLQNSQNLPYLAKCYIPVLLLISDLKLTTSVCITFQCGLFCIFHHSFEILGTSFGYVEVNIESQNIAVWANIGGRVGDNVVC